MLNQKLNKMKALLRPILLQHLQKNLLLYNKPSRHNKFNLYLKNKAASIKILHKSKYSCSNRRQLRRLQQQQKIKLI